MLFLAVFCSFLAENQREHMIEHRRVKESMKEVVENLKYDTIRCQINAWSNVEIAKGIDSLRDELKKAIRGQINGNALYYFTLRYGGTIGQAVFNTSAITELKNSGSLRYFKNEELQKLIGQLSVAIRNINDRQELEFQIRIQYLNPIILRHYDYNFEDQLTQGQVQDLFTVTSAYENNNEMIPFHFKSPAKFDKEEAINLMSFYGRAGLGATRRVHYKKYTDVNAELLKLLRKEYHLK